ncbi:UNVERIFIED_CONTAM: hypothetical protein GTU68_054051 [Idotea baltica]|nr:hypothetical protein [Idotea baltica]
MFKEDDKTVVFFERNYKTQHLQIQVVPLPSTFAPHLKETFCDISENQSINLDEVPRHSDLAQLAPPGTPFFYVELPTGEKLFHRIRKGFPLQFGRELLACPPLLNIPERVDWRECKISEEEETRLRGRIRDAYRPFDFTLEGEEDEDDSD